MKRWLVIPFALVLTAVPALAQVAPEGPTAIVAGVQRGIEELNHSGQVGYVTLFNRGSRVSIVTLVDGTKGRSEAVTIHRGRDCAIVQPIAVARLGDLTAGRSTSSVEIPMDRLLSGNYSLLVFSSVTPGARAVACAHLYR
jgi:hypothetical protein